MGDDAIVIRLLQPDEIDAPLTAILPSGFYRLLEQAIEAEIEAFLPTLKAIKRARDWAAPCGRGHGLTRHLPPGHRGHQGHGQPYRLIISSSKFWYISVWPDRRLV